MSQRYRLGVDTGGTFTDATLVGEESGELHIAKVPSTPADPAVGFIDAVRRILRENGVSPQQVTYVVHGTTVATNAVIEGNIASTALITTEGFRDMLEIGRQTRPSLYDLRFEKTPPLVPRHRCFGVPERRSANGDVIQPLDERAVRQIADALRKERVESVAVCLLHAYRYPEHEQRIGELLETWLPDVTVSLSSDVAPEIREYLRASTTVINAAIRPIVSRYLARIESVLRNDGFAAEFLVMQSNGGVYSFDAAARRPVYMVESGPAAGVMAATHLGAAAEQPNLVSFDMGGTTAKAGLVIDGQPRTSKEFEVGGMARAGNTQSTGYPIRTPAIDLVEIGAGGGSIAWVDSGGGLRVGPRSAGADPGPACYGAGGEHPTITDANLVLGRLDPDFFLGGEMPLDVERATWAIRTKCAEPLGLSVIETAGGIIDIANAHMSRAIRLVSVQRGIDVRSFSLVAFGGAGPLHANQLAHDAGIESVLIPISPGTTSAFGLLVTNLQHHETHSLGELTSSVEPADLEAWFQRLQASGSRSLLQDGIAASAQSFERSVDMRYVGQSFELTVPLPGDALSNATLADAATDFHRAHQQAYGFNAPQEPTEIVSLNLRAVGHIGKPKPVLPPESARSTTGSRERPVWFSQCGGYTACQIVSRLDIPLGDRLIGPAIVEERDSTVVVLPGYHVRRLESGSLVIEPVGKGVQ
jgi:N-methylhydantoinase A